GLRSCPRRARRPDATRGVRAGRPRSRGGRSDRRRAPGQQARRLAPPARADRGRSRDPSTAGDPQPLRARPARARRAPRLGGRLLGRGPRRVRASRRRGGRTM
ncbi:MAG: Transcriptional regulator, ArsR family, partial [uncultured Thermoleophilia bacterium]